MFKKFLSVTLSLLLVVGLVACGKSKDDIVIGVYKPTYEYWNENGLRHEGKVLIIYADGYFSYWQEKEPTKAVIDDLDGELRYIDMIPTLKSGTTKQKNEYLRKILDGKYNPLVSGWWEWNGKIRNLKEDNKQTESIKLDHKIDGHNVFLLTWQKYLATDYAGEPGGTLEYEKIEEYDVLFH